MNEKQIADIVNTVVAKLRSMDAAEHKTSADTADGHEPHRCTCKERKMTLARANALIAKVQAKASGMGLAVVVAVADAAGRPVAVQSMDGAYIASFDIALNKSFTSAALKMSTETLGQMSGPGESLYGIQYTNDGRIVIFGGGETLEWQDTIIGAIGVSGGSAAEDTYLAAYGKEVFREVMACL